MQIIKEKGNLRIFAGDGAARGLFIAENIKTGKTSLWSDSKKLNLKDCVY